MNIYNLTKNTENSKFAALEFNNIWGKYIRGALTDENKELAKIKKKLIDIANNTLNSKR